MIGRQLIIFILANHLENEDIKCGPLLENYISEQDAAVQLKVGVATIRTMFDMGMLRGVKIENDVYIHADWDGKE